MVEGEGKELISRRDDQMIKKDNRRVAEERRKDEPKQKSAGRGAEAEGAEKTDEKR